MKRRAASLPAVPPLFPPPFVRLLHALLAQGGAVLGARDERQRARRAVLSQSGSFVGHRPYVRGDDLRRLDWAAYARTGAPVTKLFEEDERRTATLLLDLSASLLAGEPPRRLGAFRLAAVVGGLLLCHLDGLTVVAPGGGGAEVATFAGGTPVAALLRHLEALPVAAAGPDRIVGLVLQRSLPGAVHWVSDFAVPKAAEAPLFALRHRGVRVTGWLPELAGDHEPPRAGLVRVADPETGDDLVVPVDGAFAAELARQLALLARQQDRLFAQAGAPLRRWRLPAADDLRPGAWQQIVAGCRR